MAVTLDRPAAMMSYAAAVETGPGLATVVLGSEDSGSVSSIEALHMADVS